MENSDDGLKFLAGATSTILLMMILCFCYLRI